MLSAHWGDHGPELNWTIMLTDGQTDKHTSRHCWRQSHPCSAGDKSPIYIVFLVAASSSSSNIKVLSNHKLSCTVSNPVFTTEIKSPKVSKSQCKSNCGFSFAHHYKTANGGLCYFCHVLRKVYSQFCPEEFAHLHLVHNYDHPIFESFRNCLSRTVASAYKVTHKSRPHSFNSIQYTVVLVHKSKLQGFTASRRLTIPAIKYSMIFWFRSGIAKGRHRKGPPSQRSIGNPVNGGPKFNNHNWQ